MNTSINLDDVLKEFGVQIIHIENGDRAIQNKIEEIANEELYKIDPRPNYFCEISWGEQFDCAIYDFGLTPGEAIQKCLNYFVKLVIRGDSKYVEVAKYFGIYERICKENVS